MGMRVNASIKIGGPITDLDALIDAIEAENLGPDWGEHFDDRAELAAYLANRTDAAFFAAYEVNGGSFDNLQDECERQGLTYRLEYAGYEGSWGPGVEVFVPGSGPTFYSQESDGGWICVTALDIRARGFESVQHILDFLDEAAKFETPALSFVGPDEISGEKKVRASHIQGGSNSGDIVDGNVSLSALDRANVGSVQAALGR